MQLPRIISLPGVSMLLPAILILALRICWGEEQTDSAGKPGRTHWTLENVTVTNVTGESGGEERLVNGIVVTPNEFPSFLWGTNPSGCQASLIRRRWALTAGHCVLLPTPKKFNVTVMDPSAWRVRAGAHIGWVPEQGEEKNYVVKIIPHPDATLLGWTDDLALLKLKEPFNLSAKIQPVELVPKGYSELDCVWVVSWRVHCEDQITPANCTTDMKIRKIDLPILPNDKCDEYLQSREFNSSKSFCAGYDEGGKGPCYGDSGAPTYVVKDGKVLQIGTVTGGKKCAGPKKPAVFGRVAAYRDWIDETIAKEEESDPTPGGP